MPTPSEEHPGNGPAAARQAELKVFLGYAPGVGKTYSMLSEAIRRRSRGEDIVIGVVESHGRKPTAELARKLDAVAPQVTEYKGTTFEEMDLAAILARKPQVVLVDELAHTNAPGSKNAKRYEDVLDLLDAGIDVLTTLNIQHIDSLTPMVQKITGIRIRETVPDWVLQRSGEIVLTDVTPAALQHRMERGDIYPLERAELALGHFFRPSNLMALRELALRQVTRGVDRSLEAFRREQGSSTVGQKVRTAVAIGSNPEAQYLIARAARIVNPVDSELYVVHVDLGGVASPLQQRMMEENLRFARNVGAIVATLTGHNIGEVLAQFARDHQITRMVFGHSQRTGLRKYFFPSSIHRFLRDGPPIDVHIVAQYDK